MLDQHQCVSIGICFHCDAEIWRNEDTERYEVPHGDPNCEHEIMVDGKLARNYEEWVLTWQ